MINGQNGSDRTNGGLCSFACDDIERVLYSRSEILSRVQELARCITNDYYDAAQKGQEIVLVTLLRGAAFFSSDLAREIQLPVQMEYMKASSYGNAATTSGTVTLESDISIDVSNKHVILVEDVIDSGITLKTLYKNMFQRNPLSVEITVFLQKECSKGAGVECKYVGFNCPDDFLVGYGLDYAGHYRNLPDVCILKPEIYS